MHGKTETARFNDQVNRRSTIPLRRRHFVDVIWKRLNIGLQNCSSSGPCTISRWSKCALSRFHHISIDVVRSIDVSNTHNSTIHTSTAPLDVEELKSPGTLWSCPANFDSPRNVNAYTFLRRSGRVACQHLTTGSKFPGRRGTCEQSRY